MPLIWRADDGFGDSRSRGRWRKGGRFGRALALLVCVGEEDGRVYGECCGVAVGWERVAVRCLFLFLCAEGEPASFHAAPAPPQASLSALNETTNAC